MQHDGMRIFRMNYDPPKQSSSDLQGYVPVTECARSGYHRRASPLLLLLLCAA
jgi:hypothetical protein